MNEIGAECFVAVAACKDHLKSFGQLIVLDLLKGKDELKSSTSRLTNSNRIFK